jgi:UPF0271 protein
MPGAVDLNADLGEGVGSDQQLLEVVTSAAVACGFHAGGPAEIRAVAEGARRLGVRLGAHPSYEDREGFGRRPVEVGAALLSTQILYQVGAVDGVARATGLRPAFVKAHGALYNRAAVDAGTADPLIAACEVLGLPLLALSGSVLWRRAQERGLAVYSEAFADRAYAPDGTLVPRSEPASVHHHPAAAARQALQLVSGRVTATDGSTVPVAVDSICVHGDTPGALGAARAVRAALEEAGVVLRPFV